MLGDLSDYVSLETLINLTRQAATGFGVAALYTAVPWSTDELTRVYTGTDGLIADYPAGHPALTWGTQYFTQAISPSLFEVHRLTDPPSIVYVISIASLKNNTVYSVNVNGTDYPITSGGSATNDATIGSLATAISGASISGLTVTTPGASTAHVLTLTWAAGTFGYASLITSDDSLDYGPSGKGLLALSATTAEPATPLLTQMTAALAERDTAYDLLTPYVGLGYGTAFAAAVENLRKFSMLVDPSSAFATHVLSGATDLAAALKALGRTRTGVIYQERPQQAIDAAWSGLMLPTEPGTENWAWAQPQGVKVSSLSSATHRSNIQDKYGNYFVRAGSRNIMWRGLMASGLKANIRRLVDKLEAQIQTRVVDAIGGASPLAVGMDQGGLQVIEGAIEQGFADMSANTGGRKVFRSYSITPADLSKILDSDLAINNATGFAYTAVPVGTIDTVKPIKGLIALA